MTYVILGFSVLWACTLTYVVFLDMQLKDISRRLKARTQSAESQG